MFLKRKLKKKSELALDEILLDSKNIPGFDTERFEGRLEFPLSQKTLKIIAVIFFAVLLVMFTKSFFLQSVQGDYFKKRAANNSLRFVFIPSPRGEIYDRKGALLAWNEPFLNINKNSDTDMGLKKTEKEKSEIANFGQLFLRKYIKKQGFSLALGFLGLSESLDDSDKNILNNKIGKDGIEKYYNEDLEGRAGVNIMEVDSLGKVISRNIKEEPQSGEKINLSLDSEITAKMHELIKSTAETRGFKGGAGIIMDVRNGEIIAMTSFPEYDSEILSSGEENNLINDYLTSDKKFFLNRAISGVYAPGSVIKPLIALAALNEKIISPGKVILTRGSITLKSPYNPDVQTVFRDWKNHGEVDMLRALAVSSDVYFYTIGGGYSGIKGLGISKIKEYAEMFNFNKKTGIDLFGEKEGIIPGPELKAKLMPEDPVWRIGDTYHASIGQGNFQTTPIEMAVYASALANKGIILKPRLLKSENDNPQIVKKVNIPEEYFDTIHKGMRLAVLEGTAKGMSDLDVAVAGKTGTAEIGKKFVNAWFIGFWPYENPRYSITVVLERGDPHNLVGGVYVARQLLGWMQWNMPEYLK